MLVLVALLVGCENSGLLAKEVDWAKQVCEPHLGMSSVKTSRPDGHGLRHSYKHGTTIGTLCRDGTYVEKFIE